MKAIESRVKKKVLDANQKSIASLISKDFLNEEATYELSKIVEIENKLNRDDLIYKDLLLHDALKLEIRLKNDINIFKESAKPKESVNYTS